MLAFLGAVTGWMGRTAGLSSYTIGARVGEGAMGVVFEGRSKSARRVAIKVCKGRTDEARRRFRREIEVTAALDHRNSVEVLAAGSTPTGTPYYVMELIDGADLDETIARRGPLGWREAADILTQLADVLEHVHARGLVHRDIKPANVVLTPSGVAKLIDFGLAHSDIDGDGGDCFIGTPHYASPEQISAPGAVCAASDIYALGALGFFLLTGRPVFDGESIAKICCDHLYEQAPPVGDVAAQAVPEDLASLIADCLRKDPTERPSSAELLEGLRDLLG